MEYFSLRSTGYISGKAYRRNSTVTTGNADPTTAYDTANEHDIYTYLGHIGTSGFILNLDSTDTLFIWVSIDGTTFFGTETGEGVGVEYIPILPSTQFSLEPMTAHTIKIGASANSISYTIVII